MSVASALSPPMYDRPIHFGWPVQHCTSGRLRHLARCASSGGWSCMVVVGRPIDFDVMGWVTETFALYVHRRSRPWITLSLVMSTVEKLGSACFGSSEWRIWHPRGRSQLRFGGCERGRWSPSLPVKASIPWSGWSLGRFGKRGTDASMSRLPCSRWPSPGPSWRTRVCGLERASCR
jgi:hypothetical protein